MKTFQNILLSCLVVAGLSQTALAKDGDVEARGPLVSLTATTVTVGSLTCNVTPATEFKDENDQPIDSSIFKVGDPVKLACRGASAKELELKINDDSAGGGDDDSNDDKGGKKGGKNNKDDQSAESRLKDRAEKTIADTSAKGKVDYKYKRDKKGRTDIRFKAWVTVPASSTVPVNPDPNVGLSLTLSLSREGTPYALCTFILNQSDDANDDSPGAEYRVDIRERRGSYSAKKGNCDIDLALDGEQSGMPGIIKGDTYSIIDSLAGEFLHGTF